MRTPTRSPEPVASIYVDQDALGIAQILRAAGHYVTTVYEIGLHGAKDERRLLTAVQCGSILVTHNGQDFHMLHRAWRL